MIPFAMPGFESVEARDLLAALAALPSLSRHLEHEIGARLHRVNIHLDAFVDPDRPALEWLIEACLRTFTPVEMTIWFRDESTGAFRVAAFRATPNADPGSSPLRLGEPLSHVVRHRTGICFDPSSSNHPTAILTPMILGSRLIGVLHIRAKDELDEDDLETLSLLSEIFTLGSFLAIHDADAVRIARTDAPDSFQGIRKAI